MYYQQTKETAKKMRELGASLGDISKKLHTLNKFFRKEENNIKLFWINFLGIKKEQFSKTTFIQTNLKKASMKNMEKYKGILRVKVRKGTALRNKILGAIEYISTA